MPHTILASVTASVSALKRNPMGTVAAGEGFPVAILNHNEPAFYCIPAKTWEATVERLDDIEDNALVNSRANGNIVKVKLVDL
ncbi:type II toxin-antitoxin system Phd/YefM family antitoxin [Burkholderia cepacia]|uniref:type II toxin-antitoxin system Phd/YefM family antitoxin n=1 Tax=Burkholderia cepacia TaxID=292 RepID=UPI00177AEA6C|nr:plasmid stabilization protein [Burkholderia cepacia]QOH37996.1 antitoxin, type II toxin-antitoxin system family protein [Burkholderia cepacia]